jgi:translation initiation factor IF-2
MKRIHELAKEQGVDPQAIVDVVKAWGLPASKCTPSSTLSEEWEKRLLPLCARLREAEKRKQERERAQAATAAHGHTHAKSKAGAAAPPAGEKHAKGTATATAPEKPAGKSGRIAAAGRKGGAPKPKRYVDDVAETAATTSPELDAWVDASVAKEKKPSKREQREAAKRATSERLPVISGEEVSALDDIPRVNLPVRPLTEEEIIRAAGLEVPPPPPPAPVEPPPAREKPARGHAAKAEAKAAADLRAAEAALAEARAAEARAAEARAAAEEAVREAGAIEAETAVAAPATPAARAAPVEAAAAPAAPAKKSEAELRAERRAEKARLERERDEWLRQEKERVERERAERDAVERAKADAVRAEREKTEREKSERERFERERAERERARREQQAREKEISPAAAALAAAFEAKKRREADLAAAEGRVAPPADDLRVEEEEPALLGDALLGEIPQEDEEIGTAVGQVPEGPVRKGPIPIVRKDKGPSRAPAAGPRGSVKTGFEQGKGFALGGRQTGGFDGVIARGGAARGGAPAAAPGQAGGKKQFFPIRGGGSPGRGAAPQVKQEKPTKVTLTPPFSIKELSEKMGVKVPDIIRTMMRKGKMITLNTPVTDELALEIGMEFNVEVEVQRRREAEDVLEQITSSVEDRPEDRKGRAPIITILGHVDHGKTSLLDRIRKANVAAGEAGGITQHIGAYKVGVGDKSVVFVDTPGHEAFTEMRARGANVTDVAVLVVAADDGVMPQTEEAYNHAKAANVPVVVALNKIDKPSANPMRVKQQLANLGLQPVEWGGATEVIEVSALTGKGIDTLLETLALQSEILELKANPTRPATGTCIEARVSEGRGIVAHLLVQEGTLRRGDVIVCGAGYGKVRALFDDRGGRIEEAPPATPAEVIGLEEVPEAGARFYVIEDLAKAKEIAGERALRKRQAALAERAGAHVTLDNLFDRLKQGAMKEIRIVLKADVKGSLEVLSKEIPAKSTDEVKVRILHDAVGGITEADVQLADASDAIIIGFNVVADEKAKARAEQKGVDIRTYRIIYQISDDIKKAMEGMLAPEEREVVHAQVEVRKIFRASQIGTIAGCMVKSGTVQRTQKARLIRDGVIKFDGEIAGLRRLKDDVKEVREGFECGITLKNYNDINEGDRIETYSIEKIARTLA